MIDFAVLRARCPRRLLGCARSPSAPRHLRRRAGVSAALLVVLAAAAACGQAQSAECKKFIACEQAYAKASDTAPTDLSQYEADGVCWQSAQNAALCDQQCNDGIAAVRQAAGDANLTVPACS